MKNLTINFQNLNLTITKTRNEWIDELAEYTLDLAYHDGEYANGILDDFLRSGFKGFHNMTNDELAADIVENLEFKYDMESV
jgi:hypothetical protein